jgi:hypothetical protein
MTDGQNNFAVFNYGENNWNTENLVKRPASMSWQCSQRSYENSLSLSKNIYSEAFQSTNIENSSKGKMNICFNLENQNIFFF